MNMTQENISNIWNRLKSGEEFDGDYPPTIVVDDEAEQVMTIPFPEGGGITVGRRDNDSDWYLI